MPVSSRSNSVTIKPKIGDRVRVLDRDKVMSMVDESGYLGDIHISTIMMDNLCGKELSVINTSYGNMFVCDSIIVSPANYWIPVEMVELCQ
jgi:hypothetical protein